MDKKLTIFCDSLLSGVIVGIPVAMIHNRYFNYFDLAIILGVAGFLYLISSFSERTAKFQDRHGEIIRLGLFLLLGAYVLMASPRVSMQYFMYLAFTYVILRAALDWLKKGVARLLANR